jgi:predicted metal-binding membrane protein
MTEWRDGHLGALTMGLRHGSVCVGCCWFLMGLMFVAGVMNILWMATVAAYILVEKVIPAGQWVGRIVGLGLVAWGVWTLVGTFG